MNKILQTILVILTFVTLPVHGACKTKPSDMYLSGYILDENGSGVSGASVIITDRDSKLYSLRSADDGWYETTRPLDSTYCKKKIRVTAIRQYYELVSKELTIDEYNTVIDLQMRYIGDESRRPEQVSQDGEILRGNVWYEDEYEPVSGALVVLTRKKDDYVITSASTRKNGNYTLNLNEEALLFDGEIVESVSHVKHDSYSGLFDKGDYSEFRRIALPRTYKRFSLGLAPHLHMTDEISDEEFGLALAVNATFFFEDTIVRDSYLNYFLGTEYHRKSGIVGIEFSGGVIPYTEETAGTRTIDTIRLYGVGLVFSAPGLPVPFSVGYARTNTDKNTFYVGFNIPLLYL